MAVVFGLYWPWCLVYTGRSIWFTLAVVFHIKMERCLVLRSKFSVALFLSLFLFDILYGNSLRNDAFNLNQVVSDNVVPLGTILVMQLETSLPFSIHIKRGRSHNVQKSVYVYVYVYGVNTKSALFLWFLTGYGIYLKGELANFSIANLMRLSMT